MPKMTEEEVRKYYDKPFQSDRAQSYVRHDIETLEGEDLLFEMEMRSSQALARCGVALDEFYPCFEKTVEIKLRDVKDRIPDQAIGCEVAADLTKSKKRTVPEQKRVERALRNLWRGGGKPESDKND